VVSVPIAVLKVDPFQSIAGKVKGFSKGSRGTALEKIGVLPNEFIYNE
jgi:hypothetical protein